jgi:hypothetical protein
MTYIIALFPGRSLQKAKKSREDDRPCTHRILRAMWAAGRWLWFDWLTVVAAAYSISGRMGLKVSCAEGLTLDD